MATTLIEGEFHQYKGKSFYHVQLSMETLKYAIRDKEHQNNNFEELQISDICGCCCMKSTSTDQLHIIYLVIYAYVLDGKLFEKRKKKTVRFEIGSKDSFEENLAIADQWRTLLYLAIYSMPDLPIGNIQESQYWPKETSNVPVPLYSSKKRILVFINPKSGPGLALEIFKKKINIIFSEAEIFQEVIVTSYEKQAYEMIQDKDLGLYSGVVVVSGDGLLYEIYNGLLQRADRNIALSTPVGIVPGGSGNGLARSIAHLLSEPYFSNPVLISALNIVNPVASPMDLVLVHTKSGNNLISFLSVGYGLMSDIDIESESLRAVGEARFTIYALARIIKLRKYKVRLSYKLASNIPLLENKGPLYKRKLKMVRSQTTEESEANLPIENQRPSSLYFDDNKEEICSIHPSFGHVWNTVYPEKTNFSSKELPKHSKPSYINNFVGDSSLEHKSYGVFDEPVPDDWVTIEDDFISIYAVNLPFVGSETFMSPRSSFSDGIMWLTFLKGDISRASVVKYMLAIDEGKHINFQGGFYIPVTDLRIEPLSTHGKITIDGELIELGPIQASVLPGKGRIMTRRK